MAQSGGIHLEELITSECWSPSHSADNPVGIILLSAAGTCLGIVAAIACDYAGCGGFLVRSRDHLRTPHRWDGDQAASGICVRSP
jgi:hypothetical protein